MTTFGKFSVAFWIVFMSLYVLFGFYNFFNNNWWTLAADVIAVIGGIFNLRLTNHLFIKRLAYR